MDGTLLSIPLAAEYCSAADEEVDEEDEEEDEHEEEEEDTLVTVPVAVTIGLAYCSPEDGTLLHGWNGCWSVDGTLVRVPAAYCSAEGTLVTALTVLVYCSTEIDRSSQAAAAGGGNSAGAVLLLHGRYSGEGAQVTGRAARGHRRRASERHRASFRVVAGRPFKRYWKIEGCKVK